MASFALTLPACSDVRTQITMQLDGDVIQGSMINVIKVPGAPGSAFVQVVFDVCMPGAQLEVITSAELSLEAEEECDTLASLTLVQIDGMYNHRRHENNLSDFERSCRHSQRHSCNCNH